MFPNNYQGDSLYYVNPQAFDLSSGTAWGSMNIHMNQAWDDMITRQNLYNVPLYNFSNFSQYATPWGGNAFGQIFEYSMRQWDWQNKAAGGCGFFDENGNFKAPWSQNPSDLWRSAGAWSPSGNRTTSTETSSTPSGLSENERNYLRKYNALFAIVKQLAKAEDLTAAQKRELNGIIQNPPRGTNEEKYEALEKVYKKIPSETVVNALTTANEVKVGEYNSTEAKSFVDELLAAGYEYAGQEMDNAVRSMHDAITKLDSDTGNITSDNLIGKLIATSDKVNILDVISSYNTIYGTDKNIVKHFAEYYDKLEDDENKETALPALKSIVNALINKADTIRNNLDTESNEKVKEAIDKAQKALDNSSDKIDSSLANAFDELYLLTRLGAMAVLRNKVIDYYQDIDPKVFNQKIFNDKTIEDLEKEGFENSDITSIELKVKNPAQTQTTQDTEDVNNQPNDGEASPYREELTEEQKTEQAQKEAKDKKAKALNKTLNDLDKNNIVEKKGDKYVLASTGEEIDLEELAEVDDPKKFLTEKYYEMTEEEIEDAKKIGDEIKALIDSYTTDDDWAEVKTNVNKINKRNVLYVIKAFNDDAFFHMKFAPREDFFTHCQSEYQDEKVDKLTKPVLKCIIKFIDDNLVSLNAKDRENVLPIKENLEAALKELTVDTKGNYIDKQINSLIEIFQIK